MTYYTITLINSKLADDTKLKCQIYTNNINCHIVGFIYNHYIICQRTVQYNLAINHYENSRPATQIRCRTTETTKFFVVYYNIYSFNNLTSWTRSAELIFLSLLISAASVPDSIPVIMRAREIRSAVFTTPFPSMSYFA